MKHIYTTIAILSLVGCSTHPPSPFDHKDLFRDLLSRGAPRTEVELIAALGSDYKNNPSSFDPSVINSVKRSLEGQGKSDLEFYYNEVYRINKIKDAKSILRKKDFWYASDFDDKVKEYFRRYPIVSLAIMENDDQRLFFFDHEGRLVAYKQIYAADGPTGDGFG